MHIEKNPKASRRRRLRCSVFLLAGGFETSFKGIEYAKNNYGAINLVQ